MISVSSIILSFLSLFLDKQSFLFDLYHSWNLMEPPVRMRAEVKSWNFLEPLPVRMGAEVRSWSLSRLLAFWAWEEFRFLLCYDHLGSFHFEAQNFNSSWRFCLVLVQVNTLCGFMTWVLKIPSSFRAFPVWVKIQDVRLHTNSKFFRCLLALRFAPMYFGDGFLILNLK